MGWVLHNVIADLYGPYFLAFYAAVIVVLIVACWRSIRGVDRTGDLEPPEVPAKLDPYEVAYLRGGENEVTRVAIASMIQRGLLRIAEEKHWTGTTRKIDRGRDPRRGELNRVEAAVWKWPGYPADPRTVFQAGGIPPLIAEMCAPYEASLAEEGLLAPREMKELADRLWSIGMAIIILLGLYKLGVAVAKGHSNVAFLMLIGFFGAMILSAVCKVLPRMSRRGKAYLERLKLAHGRLKGRLDTAGEWTATGPDADDRPGSKGPARSGAFDSGCLMLVGVFGISALSDTPLSDLNTMFTRGASSGGGCGGGGCGGGGGGCGGGGCGGCGS